MMISEEQFARENMPVIEVEATPNLNVRAAYANLFGGTSTSVDDMPAVEDVDGAVVIKLK